MGRTLLSGRTKYVYRICVEDLVKTDNLANVSLGEIITQKWNMFLEYYVMVLGMKERVVL